MPRKAALAPAKTLPDTPASGPSVRGGRSPANREPTAQNRALLLHNRDAPKRFHSRYVLVRIQAHPAYAAQDTARPRPEKWDRVRNGHIQEETKSWCRMQKKACCGGAAECLQVHAVFCPVLRS